jgi:DNA-binding response OmpR family regulator
MSQESQLPTQPQGTEEQASESKKRVLIVEDDPEILNFYKEYLAKYFEIDTATDGEQGLHTLSVNSYDLVLLDIMIPKIDGIEFLKRKGSIDNIAKIPVVVLTNLSSGDVINDIFKYGAKNYIFKAETTPDKIIPVLMDAISPAG